MKKRIGSILIVTALIGCLTGCGNVIADLSEEQSEQISEYAAAVLLSYDEGYHSRLLDEEEMAKAEEEEAIVKARAEAAAKIAETYAQEESKTDNQNDAENEAGNTDASVQTEESVDLAQFLELTGFEVQYAGASIEDSYPTTISSEDGQAADSVFFSMKATAGNKLLVLKFNVQNVSEQDQVLDLLSKKIYFYVESDQFGKKGTMVTMLEDDLSAYNGNVPAGSSVEGVLVAEISEEEAANIGGLVLDVKYNEDTASIKLQ